MMIWREVPPTAGLPLRWRDFFPRRGAADFEAALARLLDLPAVQVECSGTAALIIALETLKRRSARRAVVLPAYTCPLVPLAVAAAGLEARLCDLLPDRFDFDPAALAALCDEETLCVVPTHLGGRVADLAPAIEIARRVGACVIEDAAQALGATWRGRPVGTFGDIGFYSLARGKGLTLYEGGVLVARDPELRAALRETGARRVPIQRGMEAIRLLQLFGYRLAYNPTMLRLTYGLPLRYWLRRGDPVRAVGDYFPPEIPLHQVGGGRRRIGASALSRLPAAMAENAERGRRRAKALGELPGLRVMEDGPEREGTWPFLTVVFDAAEARDRALSRLWRSGLGVSRLFIHDLQGYSYLREITRGAAAPNARSLAARALTISNSPWLSEADFAYIREALREALKEAAPPPSRGGRRVFG